MMKNDRRLTIREVLLAVAVLSISLAAFASILGRGGNLSDSAIVGLWLFSTLAGGGAMGWPIATVVWGRQYAVRGFICGGLGALITTVGVPTLASILRPFLSP